MSDTIEHPTWTFEQSYYDINNKNTGFEIRTDPVKGKGLFALKRFEVGDIVLMERALVAAQNIDERFTPVCEHCLVSLESPSEIVKRVTRSGEMVATFEKSAAKFSPPFPAIIRCVQCDMTRFCSEACREEGMRLHHHAMCTAKMSEKGRSALKAFLEHPWQQGGVDYTDTNGVALRLVARCLSQYRTNAVKSLAEAFQPLNQLIRAPIDRFHFSFLLKPEGTTEEEAWADFVKHRAAPELAPEVVEAEAAAGNITKAAMVRIGYEWMVTLFDLTAEEKAVITEPVWSELLGAVLLNGQERTPNSPYTLFMRKARESDSSFLREFHAAVKAKGFDPTDFRSSTKGQAIYPIGCLFNHSCRPNLEVQYDEEINNETLVAYCKAPIAVGDELCISYIDEEMDFRGRQQQLEEHYLFRCGCPACAEEAPKFLP